jgi:hypothetical protein
LTFTSSFTFRVNARVEGAMGPFSKNLSLSNFCKIKNKYNIPLAVFEEQLQNLAFGEPQGFNLKMKGYV